MKRLLILGATLVAHFVTPALAQEPTKLLNASYDVSRELFVAENEAFIKQHPGVTIDQSHAGTSKQARS
ncbi:MAG: sulfate ABC transporter substrate-binding protein, partial [Ensifer adhaerens]